MLKVLNVRSSALLLTSAMAFACQAGQHGADSNVKIVGGTSVKASDPIARSTVAIIIQSTEGTALCTGSLIDTRHIVSAGHCLAGSPQQVAVDFDLELTSTPKSLIGAQTFAVNQNYGAESTVTPPSDISLLTLDSDAPYGFGPVPMLSTDDQVNEGETVTLAGYGQTSINDQNPTHLLRKVNVTLVSANATTEELEVGNTPGRGACHGDSGGPAFVKRDGSLYLVGVTSRDTNPDGRCESNTVYTDVRYYQDWITSNEN